MNTDTERQTEEEYVMPSAEAVLAGTLALMTGYAQCRCSQNRLLMARKIHANLFDLAAHPALSANFKLVMQRMSQHWSQLPEPAQPQLSSAAETGALSETPKMWHQSTPWVH